MKKMLAILLALLTVITGTYPVFAASSDTLDTRETVLGQSNEKFSSLRASGAGLLEISDDAMIWYDMTETTGYELSGSNVKTIINKGSGGSAYNAVQNNAGEQAQYVASGDVSCKPALRLRDGDYMQIGGDNGFYLEDMTIVMVLNIDDFTGTNGDQSHQLISRKESGGGNHNWYFNITDEYTSRGVNFGWKTLSGGWSGVKNSPQVLSANENYLLIAKKDGANGATFVNGEKSIVVDGGAVPEDNSDKVYLGVPSGNGDNEVSINADISEVMIFDRGLSDLEIAELQDGLNRKYSIGIYEGAVDPSTLSGLTAWYDASDITLTDGSNIADWENKANAGTNNASQTAAVNQPVFVQSSPINNKPAVKLDKNTFLEVDSPFNLDDMSIFAVINPTDLSGNGDENQIFSKLATVSPWNHNWFFNINQERFNFGWKENGGDFKEYSGNNAKLSGNTNYILNGNKDGLEGSLVINGKQIGQMTAAISQPAHNIDKIYIGGAGAGKSMTGYISEIIVFDEALSAADTEGVNIYLANKWDIGLDVDSNLNGKIKIGDYELRMFSPNTPDYKHTLPYGSAVSDIPTVTADFTEAGGMAVVTQATTLPGTSKISVQNGGTTNEYTIDFDVLEKEILDLEIPEIEDVEILDGFWKDQLDEFKNTTAKDVLTKLEVNSGTLENFKRIAEGRTNEGTVGNTDPWNDGLLYETITGAAGFLRSMPDGDPVKTDLINQIDGYIDIIASAQESNGYLSTHAQIENPGRYFDATRNARWYHDAYNFGCLSEAAVNYYRATGDTKLLGVATKFAEFLVDGYGYGEKNGAPKINMVPSHEGPEEWLLEMYWIYKENPTLKATIESDLGGITIDEEAYGDLVKFWIENRGNYDNRVYNEELGWTYTVYAQDHKRFYEQTQGEGHAVRANLFYAGMAAAGLEFKDYTYLSSADIIWQNIVDKQMYITGGVGALGHDEAYGPDYYLPNDGYCETCAQVAMGSFSMYLNRAFGEGKYAENIEKHMYNGALGAIGLNSTSYYYQQPLYDKQRDRWDWVNHTPCCPPMFLKFFSDLSTYIYAYDDDNIYVNQFISSSANLDNGVNIEMLSNMPWESTTKIKTDTGATLHIRIPSWTEAASIKIKVNDSLKSYTTDKGYAVISVNANDNVELTFDLEAKREYSDTNVTYNEGKVAITYGPIAYTIESTDNRLVPYIEQSDSTLSLPTSSVLVANKETTSFPPSSFPRLGDGVVTIEFDTEFYSSDGTLQTTRATAVPFFARGNRGKSTNFVWINEEAQERGGTNKRWLAKSENTRDVGKSAAAAFDDNIATFWSAGSSEVPQVLVVDLEADTNIAKAVIDFTSTQAWKYKVLYSSDGVGWNIFADRSTNSSTNQSFADTGSVNARYVAYVFTESAGVGYITVRDISLTESGSAVNLAKNKMCTASSSLETSDSVFSMIDGDERSTRYCPPNGNMPQTMTMDIGAVAGIEGMDIVFEKTSDWGYKIEVSRDGTNWTEYDTQTVSIAEPNLKHSINQVATGRYIKLTLTGTTGGVWGSIWEFDVRTTDTLPDIIDSVLGIVRYNIIIGAVTNGSVTADKKIVTEGGTITLTAVPNSGYELKSLKVNGVSQTVDINGKAVVNNVRENLNITASFVPVGTIKYTVTATAGSGGDISPSGSVVVNKGEDITFTLTAKNGHEIDKLTVDGLVVAVDTQGKHVLANIQKDLQVLAAFKQINQPVNKVKLTAFAGVGGTITPNGEIIIDKGGSQVFTIKADSGYKITAIVANGKTQSIDDNGSLVLTKVEENTSVVAIFEKIIDSTYVPPTTAPSTQGRSSSSSSGGSSKADVSIAPSVQTKNNTSNVGKIVDHTETIQETKNAAENSTGNKVVISRKNYDIIGAKTIKGMAEIARNTSKNITMHADTTLPNSKKVMGRLYLDFAGNSTAETDVKLGVHTVGDYVSKTKLVFEKYFSNEMQFVYIAYEGAFISTTEVAVILDSKLTDKTDLHFYSVNKDTNSYSELKDVKYWKDQNGYLHFFVTEGGSIVIADGLMKKR